MVRHDMNHEWGEVFFFPLRRDTFKHENGEKRKKVRDDG